MECFLLLCRMLRFSVPVDDGAKAKAGEYDVPVVSKHAIRNNSTTIDAGNEPRTFAAIVPVALCWLLLVFFIFPAKE